MVVNFAFASETTERRIQISLPLFPRIIAVDADFQNKLNINQLAHLAFIYDRDISKANQIVDLVVRKHKTIGAVKVSAHTKSIDQLLHEPQQVPTAIFVVERLSDVDLKRLMTFAIKNQIIVFSPFSGDVERGATVGISITSRVQPYFNLKTLTDSKININPILLNMSKHYE